MRYVASWCLASSRCVTLRVGIFITLRLDFHSGLDLNKTAAVFAAAAAVDTGVQKTVSKHGGPGKTFSSTTRELS